VRPALTVTFALLLLASGAASAEPSESLRLQIQPGVARPGDAVLISVRGASALPEGTLGAEKLRFHSLGNAYLALVGLSVDQTPAELEVKVRVKASEGMDAGTAGERALSGVLEVVAPNFPERELKVDNKYIEIPKDVKKRIAEDRAAFAKAFKGVSPELFFKGNFAWPRPGVVTAPFGDLRTFNGKKQSQHYGTDVDGKTGAPIYASNDGKVVLVRDCYGSGRTVLIHHGGSLYSAYFHMSKFEINNGVKVKQGQLLGLVGKTGRVTGPHLHWGIKIDGRWVNAESLLRLDFEN
jgi:murein DD-endopeptidase MepM/ murein hydrolase activator NlpD